VSESDATPVPVREPTSGLYTDVLARAGYLIGEPLLEVLKASRRLEVVTGDINLVARQNLLEAFSHLGVLFTSGPSRDQAWQVEQVTHISDHLRRALMEGFEQALNVALADVWNDQDRRSVGRRYDAIVVPLVKRGKLMGHVAPADVLRRKDDILQRALEARDAKAGDGDWDDWKTAAQHFEMAAEELRDLRREMGAAVDAADDKRAGYRNLVIGIVAGLGTGIVAIVVVQLLT
jgi:hypothetical protein